MEKQVKLDSDEIKWLYYFLCRNDENREFTLEEIIDDTKYTFLLGRNSHKEYYQKIIKTEKIS